MSISGHETLISLNGTQSYVAKKEGGGKERGVGYAASCFKDVHFYKNIIKIPA